MRKTLGIKLSGSTAKEDHESQIGWAIRDNENLKKLNTKVNLSESEVAMEARKVIGKLFQQIREKKELSLIAISKKTSLSTEEIQNIENGNKSYSIDSFLKMSYGLDCYFFLESKDGNHLNEDHFNSKFPK